MYTLSLFYILASDTICLQRVRDGFVPLNVPVEVAEHALDVHMYALFCDE